MTFAQASIRWQLFCDGTARPNPGAMAIGAVLIDPAGARHSLSQALGRVGCNNEAEAEALIAALQWARNLGAEVMQVYSDNSVLIEQLSAAPAPMVARLRPVFARARDMLKAFSGVSLHWLPAHRNREADALARAALGLSPRQPAAPKRRGRA